MPLIETIERDGYAIGIWEISEDTETLAKNLDERLTATEPYSGFKNEKRKKEWLAVRCLLKKMEGENAAIAYEGEKPYLTGCDKHISITHTKGYAAIATGDRAVGIDIEQKSDRAHKIRNAFMDEQEADRCEKSGNSRDYATMIWSVKEAVYKASEKGCYDFKTYVHTAAEGIQANAKSTASENCDDKELHFETEYWNNEDFILTTALQTR